MSDSILVRIVGFPVGLSACWFVWWRLAVLLPDRRPLRRLVAALLLGGSALALATLLPVVQASFPGLAVVAPAWMRLVSLAVVVCLAETGLSWFLPTRRRTWARAALMSLAILGPLVLINPAGRVDWISFTRKHLFLFAYVGIHLFVFVRLAGGFGLGSRGRRWLAALLWAGGALFPLRSQRGAFLLRTVSGVWAGSVMLLFCALLLEALLTLAAPRRRRLWTAVSLALGLLAAAVALENGRRLPAVRELVVPVPSLTAAQDGFTVAFLADLHLGGVESQAWLEGVVGRVNGLEPDLIAIGGDLLERYIPRAKMDALAGLRARYGVVAVPGNHEFYMGIERFRRRAEEMGLTVLRNESVRLGNGVQVAGLDDPAGWRFGNGGPDLRKALRGTARGQPLLLLSHSPRFFAEAAARGVDLQLSGHTHAGQLAPWGWTSRIFYRYYSGLYRLGDSRIYTTSGAGVWGLPMRLGSRNEIVHVTLRRAP